MRITLEIPDDLLNQAELFAAREGLSLKSLIQRALRRDLAIPSRPKTHALRKQWAMRFFDALDRAKNTESVGLIKRKDLYERKILRKHEES